MDAGHENALKGLLNRYQRQDDERLANESLIRQSFIDPFLEHVLGWDVRDPDVCRPEVTRANRRMDYVFYDEGLRLFVVEAKAATRELFDDDQSYQQALEYAFNADLPFVILTNFRQWIVLSPKIAAESPRGRELFRIDLLSESLDLTKLLFFSKESWFSSGKDALYGLLARHKPQEPVDKILLDDLSRWREVLLANLRKSTKDDESWRTEEGRLALETELQRYLDRLIFICYCEDAELENPELLSLIRQKRSQHTGRVGWLRESVVKLFEQYRKTFNSDLFDLGQSDRFLFDDARVEEVVSAMREPRTVQKGVKRPPYDFARIPADVLGRVYENFIGHIQQAVGRGFRESEDKGKRKKEGIYYTPQYIVDSIVNETVRPKIKGKTFEEISSLRIVDPACGSGSFLIRAYDALIDEAEKSLGRKPTYAERKKLLGCIYGVDLDDRAIQVAKLNLALRMAERGKQLPRLDDMIRHGNSLIDDPSVAGFKAFRWKDEFSDVFEGGGFDVVIGNPPYIRIQTLKSNSPTQVSWLNEHYASGGHGNYDIYVLFVERGLSVLKQGGSLGYILPHKFFNAKYGSGLRTLIADGKNLSKVVHFGDEQVFHGATTYTCLLFLEQKQKRSVDFVKVDDLEAWKRTGKAERGKINQTQVSGSEWNFVIGPAAEVFEKLSKMPVKLGDVARVFQGAISGLDSVFVLRRNGPGEYITYNGDKIYLEDESTLPLYKSSVHFRRYSLNDTDLRIVFPYRLVGQRATLLQPEDFRSKYPLCWDYMSSQRKLLESREKGKWKRADWYSFSRTQNIREMISHKIISQVLSTRGTFSYDDSGVAFLGGGTAGGNGIMIKEESTVDYRFLLGILNSQVTSFFVRNTASGFRGAYFVFAKSSLDSLPIPTYDNDTLLKDNRIVTLVDHMLELHKQLDSAMGSKKDLIEREIERTDNRIDDIVYDLYGITDDERKIIESSRSSKA